VFFFLNWSKRRYLKTARNQPISFALRLRNLCISIRNCGLLFSGISNSHMANSFGVRNTHVLRKVPRIISNAPSAAVGIAASVESLAWDGVVFDWDPMISSLAEMADAREVAERIDPNDRRTNKQRRAEYYEMMDERAKGRAEREAVRESSIFTEEE